MTTNYVGSVTVIDRGDAPAQAIMDRNARSLAQRVADETRDELEKVLSRVENIYGSFEMNSDYNGDANMEYVNDIGELEELIKDQVKKRKYQQQVTIFVVGFQEVCGQKLRLLQQVNEFFMENSKSYEEEDWFPRTPDIDLDDVADSIEDSLATAHDLTNRLGELNKEIVECLAAYAEKKATNRGKKKLERALQLAKDEVSSLSEKLLAIQAEIEEKDEKMQALFKQLEVKNLELQRFKTAAEVAKKNVQDSERLQAEIEARDEKIQELRQNINRLEIEVTSSHHNQEMSQSKLASASEENQHRIVQLTKEVEEGKVAIEEAKRDLHHHHQSQLNSLQESHHAEMEELKAQHAQEIQQLMEELEQTKQELIAAQHRAAQLQLDKGERSDTASDVTKHFDLDPSEPPSQDTTRQSTREGSRQSQRSKGKSKSKCKYGDSRSNKSSRQGSVASKKSGKSPNRQSESKPSSRVSVKQGGQDIGDDIIDITQFTRAEAKEYAEAAIQDEGGNPSLSSVEKSKVPSTKGRRSKAGLAPVHETDTADLDNAFDLMDDAAWAAVPADQVPGRFSQYRKLCKRRVAELEEQLHLTQAKTQRKVTTLKAQFQEHKGKWEAERKLLIEQVSQAHKLQNEAEKEADAAMTQLEEFINEQEKLEQDEEVKRRVILGKTDAVAMEAKTAAQQEETTPEDAAPPRDGQETDLNRLMQQTDDAKKSVHSSPDGTRSSPGRSTNSSMDAVLQVKNKNGENVPQPTDGTPLGKTKSPLINTRKTSCPDKMSDSSPTEIGPIPQVLYQGRTTDGVITKLLTPSSAVIQILTVKSKAIENLEYYTSSTRNGQDVKAEKASLLAVPERGITHADGLSELTTDEGYSTVPDGQEDTVADYQQDVINLEDLRNVLDEGEITQRGQDSIRLVNPETISIGFPEADKDQVQELNARMTTSGAMSAPPAVEGEEVPEDKSHTKVTTVRQRRDKVVHPSGLKLDHQLSTVEELFDQMYNEQTVGSFKNKPRLSLTLDTKTEEIKTDLDFIQNNEGMLLPKSLEDVKLLPQIEDYQLFGKMSAPKFHFSRVPSQILTQTAEGFPINDVKVLVTPSSHLVLGHPQTGGITRGIFPGDVAERKFHSAVEPDEGLVESTRTENPEAADTVLDGQVESTTNMEKPKVTEEVKKPEQLQVREECFDVNSVDWNPEGSFQSQLTLVDGFPYIVHKNISVAQNKEEEISQYFRSNTESLKSAAPTSNTLGENDGSANVDETSLKSSWSEMEANRDFSIMYSSPSIKEELLPASQKVTVKTLKKLMTQSSSEDKQEKLHEMVKQVVKTVTRQKELTDEEKIRTRTLVALAALIVLEENAIGLVGGEVFGSLGNLMPEDWAELTAGFREEIDSDSFAESLESPQTDSPFPKSQTAPQLEVNPDTVDRKRSLTPDLEDAARQKSNMSSASSRKSAITTQSLRSDRSQNSLEKEASEDVSKDVEASKSGTVSRASQTPTDKTKRLTPSTEMMRENSSVSAASGLLEVPQSPGKFDTSAEEEIRASSARSRASLRNQFRQRLEETRKVVDERRIKSPGITIPTPRSMDEDELNIEDDDEDVPLPDDMKEEYRNKTLDIGTSPPPGIKREDTLVSVTDVRHTPSLAEHPVVQDFVKVYDGVVQFKDSLGRILMDKEMMSASQILSDLDTLQFDKTTKIQPQINNMTHNIYFMLEEIGSLLNNILLFDREPAVSSLINVSRDPTKGTFMRDETDASVTQRLSTRGSQQSQSSDLKTSSTVRELQDQYHKLAEQFEQETKKHEEQLRHNTVVMMEMQDTINDLQRELSTLGKSAKRSRSATPNLAQDKILGFCNTDALLDTDQKLTHMWRTQQIPSPEASVMFTRLDSERNAKIMKKAVLDDRLGTDRYKEAVSQMNQYVSLPAQRLAHLVSKYVHHCRMKAIEENVKKSDSLNENVFEVLDKMEALQNERARKWAEHMDEMGSERMKLANTLMETLDSIEQESGLFLIKPMYSFRGREMKQKYVGKLARPVRPRRASPTRETVSSMAPAPTPSSHIRPLRDDRAYQKISSASSVTRSRPEPLRPLQGDSNGISGASMTWVGQSPRQTWSFSSSHAKTVQGDPLNLYNTPRILELDINRMLIGQNNISSILPQPITEDRLVNASQNNLRSYVTVNRPVATPSITTNTSRPRSTGTPRDSAPPTTPQQSSSAGKKKVRVSETDLDMPKSLRHRSPPLPPIAAAEPPHSPSGSSIRQTPPVKDETTDTHGKTLTRESSRLTSTTGSEDE